METCLDTIVETIDLMGFNHTRKFRGDKFSSLPKNRLSTEIFRKKLGKFSKPLIELKNEHFFPILPGKIQSAQEIPRTNISIQELN